MRYISFFDTDGVEEPDQPKRHLIIHMVKYMQWFGNWSFYANWREEHLNKLLKAHCRTISQGTFDSFLLLRIRDALMSESRQANVGMK